MRVLIVSHYFAPENFSINQIAEALDARDFEVEVLTGQPNYPEGVIYEGYSALGASTCQEQSLTVHRVPLLPRGKGAVRLALNYLSFLISATLFGPWLLRGRSFDVVFFYGVSPLLSGLPALFIGWMKSAPVIIWVLDLWPESLSATGYIKNSSVLKFIEKLVRFIYTRADLVLVQSEAFLAGVKKLAGSTPVVYYPNSVSALFTQEDSSGAALPLPDFSDKFIVLFAGNIGKAQASATIVEAARLLTGVPDIQLVLVGDGRMRPEIQKEIEKGGLANISLPGKFPIEAMPAFMKQASALLVTLTDEAIFAKTVPNKVQAYLAAGRPIIAALNGEGARVVQAAQAGLAVRAEDAAGLAAACRALYEMSAEERAAMGESGRAYFDAHFDPDRLIDDLSAHFHSLQKH